jgi:hypothetical protein
VTSVHRVVQMECWLRADVGTSGSAPDTARPGYEGGRAGKKVSGAGGRNPSDERGRMVLSCCRHASVAILASSSVWKISPLRSSSQGLPLKLSQQPFSQGQPDSI